MPCQLNHIHQLGIIVPDALKATENFCRLFSLDPTAAKYVDSQKCGKMEIKLYSRTIESYNTFTTIQRGGIEFEFIQHSAGEKNLQRQYIDRHGPGIQHICLDVNNYDETIAFLSSMNAATAVEGGQAAYGYKFMDMLGDMGLMMEIYNEGLMSDRRNASEAACLAEPDAIILEKVNHIGVVVADAPTAAQTLCKMCGIGEENIRLIDQKALSAASSAEKNRGYSLLATVPAGGIEFEFIQFLDGTPNFHKKFFDLHGPGIQHIAVTVNDWHKAAEKMLAMGGTEVYSGGNEGNRFKYIDMRPQMGIIFELNER